MKRSRREAMVEGGVGGEMEGGGGGGSGSGGGGCSRGWW